MKRLLFLLSFLSFAKEYQHLLSYTDVLVYTKGHYPDVLKSPQIFYKLEQQNSYTQQTVNLFMSDMLANIREDKEKEYNAWCGNPSTQCQAACVGGCAVGSPLAWFLGWYTKYFLLSMSGAIGTVFFLPAIGYGVIKSCNTYNKLDVYEEVAVEWQKALMHKKIIPAQTMPME
jgi:glutaredoxin-related protein